MSEHERAEWEKRINLLAAQTKAAEAQTAFWTTAQSSLFWIRGSVPSIQSAILSMADRIGRKS